MINTETMAAVFKGKIRHPYYAESSEAYYKMRVHMDGLYPKRLISERRPKEDAAVQKYREMIYVPITMEPINKVESSLQKIRRSEDWAVRHNIEDLPKAVIESESPQVYFEHKYPNYSYLGAWVFSEVLRNYMIDANSYVAIMPLEIPTDKSAYVRPYPQIFNSPQVLHIDEEMAVFAANNVDEFDMETGYASQDIKDFWVFTKVEVARYVKVKNSYEQTYLYTHNLGYIPTFKMRGVYVDNIGMYVLHRSRFYAMCPRLDEAAREHSDLQAEVVQNIFTERWEIRFPDCKTCKGTGKSAAASGQGYVSCKRCGGSGYDASPYAKLSINPNAITNAGAAIPTPPVGVVQKDTAIAKLQDQRVQDHIYRALSAVNFQFLAQVPQVQSGVAKEVDRDELNNTVHSVAEDIVWVMENVYRISIDMRYGTIIPDAEIRKALIPKIAIPERNNLLSTTHLMEEMKQARDSGASPAIIAEMQVELANKRFYNAPEVKDVVNIMYELDPLPGYTPDEKAMMEMNGWATKEDIVISAYLTTFVRRAMRENKDFATRTYDEKMALMREYAKEKEAMPVPAVPIAPVIETVDGE